MSGLADILMGIGAMVGTATTYDKDVAMAACWEEAKQVCVAEGTKDCTDTNVLKFDYYLKSECYEEIEKM